MKIKELRDLNNEELNAKVKECKAKMLDIKFKMAVHQVENTSEISLLKHQIAQVKTILRERELEEELEVTN